MINNQVLFIDTVHPILQEQLETAGYKCTDAGSWERGKILKNLNAYTGIVIRSRIPVDRELLDCAPNLKFIARAGAGMENIDVEYARLKGVACINAPEGNREAVAEHMLGMLLALLNNLITANSEVRKGIWRREENRGTELSGKTVSIIGFGNMGTSFASVLSGFEINILVYDPYIKINHEKYVNVKQVSMDDVFKESDVISLHVPLTTETTYMVEENFINQFQKPFYLLNSSRGKVVKTRAVADALDSGKIKGAALDVLEFETGSFEKLSETQIPDELNRLYNMNNVILTPHIAGWSFESHKKISEILARKIFDQVQI